MNSNFIEENLHTSSLKAFFLPFLYVSTSQEVKNG